MPTVDVGLKREADLTAFAVRRSASAAVVYRDPARDRDQLLFPVPTHEPELFGRGACGNAEIRAGTRSAAGDLGPRRLFESRKPLVHPLVESRAQSPFGANDVEGLDAGHAREQIEIGDEQPVRVGNPVRHGYHDVRNRLLERGLDEPRAQEMFIARPAALYPLFEQRQRALDEMGLAKHPLGAAIGRELRRRSPARSARRTVRASGTDGAAGHTASPFRRPGQAGHETAGPVWPAKRRAQPIAQSPRVRRPSNAAAPRSAHAVPRRVRRESAPGQAAEWIA